jgi:multimeric flavodoxin WrbA
VSTVAVVYHSATGRTRALAEAVGRGAARVSGVSTRVMHVDEAGRAQAALAEADAIVFGCPTYMGSASASFKAFMDATSAIWALQGWRDKIAAGFTHSAAPSGDKLGTLLQLAVFAAQHGMVWVGLGLPPTYAAIEDTTDDTNRLGSHLGAMAQSRPGGGTVPKGDLETAELLGRRVAEATVRWSARVAHDDHPVRHPTTRGWAFPPRRRSAPPAGVLRTNVRELAARPGRLEHHLTVCAAVAGAQLEIATASEPLYFAHINISDEYALALPTGDDLVDRFPLRTFLAEPERGGDVGRYNHRVGDLVLHPYGLLHWPGRLRPPYEPFDFPPGMRRAGLSLVYCANVPTPPEPASLPPPPEREDVAKAYVSPPPRMVVASVRGHVGVLARIGTTELSLHELPETIAPPRGGWALVLEAEAGTTHFAGDLYRIDEGCSLDAKGIVRVLVLASSDAPPEPPPKSWDEVPPLPFPVYEEAAPGALPVALGTLSIAATSASTVRATIGELEAELPRHWLARMLYRVAAHGLRMGYAETYGGFFVDDRGDIVAIGLRVGETRASMTLPRGSAMTAIERLYRAVAPAGYKEHPV